jgi:hypoxanthine phosphoribosyltransferase
MVMQDLKKIETVVLLTMMAAHSSYYRRALTVDEVADCKTTIGLIQNEIAFRSANKKKFDN